MTTSETLDAVMSLGSDSMPALLADVARETELSDFGDDSFLAGLRILLQAIGESDLGATDRARLLQTCRDRLALRLRIVEGAKQRSEPAAQVASPLVVTGLPRTGTTALVDLLAQDPGTRSPTQWEVKHLGSEGVVPPDPAPSDTWIPDPTVHNQQVVALGLHTYGQDLPAECTTFMALEFRWGFVERLPRWTTWRRTTSTPGAYWTHELVLQHLAGAGPSPQWVLKSPHHLYLLDSLVTSYPTARIVQTHRDPVKVLPSLCGLYATYRGLDLADREAAVRLGRELLDDWGTAMEHALNSRLDPAVESAVIDVSHRDLIDDPMGVVHSIYDAVGFDRSADSDERMAAWTASPRQEFSRVTFSLEDFGLDQAAVQGRFEAYFDRFGRLL